MFGESVGSLSEQLKRAKESKKNSEAPKPIRAEYVQEMKKSPSEYRDESVKNQEEVIQKRRIATTKPAQHVYPERVFDQYERKTTWLRGEDIDVLKAVASEIMSGRKRATSDYSGMNRVTDNNIIRILIQNFCERVGSDLHHTDFSKIQTDEEIKSYIDQVMRF